MTNVNPRIDAAWLRRVGISEPSLLRAAQDTLFDNANPGFCVTCGIELGGIEPDASVYPCESCGDAAGVYGAELLLLMTVA